MKTTLKTKRKSRLGAATVEMAFCLPIFLLAVFANVEVGRGLVAQQVLVNAARVGSRACIVGGLTAAETEQVVIDYVADNNLQGVYVTVTPEPTTASIGDPITVTASVNYNDVRILSPRYLMDRTLSASSTMRKERED